MSVTASKPLSLAKNQKLFKLKTTTCRKISTKDDEQNGFTIYVGQAPVDAFIDLPEDQNVREFIPESGERRQFSNVHHAILDTLKNRPYIFPVLNGGISIVVEAIHLDDNQKNITLTNPSIINGSQTRGIIKDFLDNLNTDFEEEFELPNVKFEIILTEDPAIAADTSIARNLQTPVKPISILGRKEYFEELKASFKDSSDKKRTIRSSETDRDPEEFIPTEKLLQVIAALIPEELWDSTNRGEFTNKNFAYSSSAGPLKLFKKAYEEKDENPALYQFYLDIASQAWDLYEKWNRHPGFKRVKNGIVRDKGNITDVSDGITFPIIAAHSAFIKKGKRWELSIPAVWKDSDIITNAMAYFKDTAKSNPNVMGKSKGAYSSLYGFTSLAARYARS